MVEARTEAYGFSNDTRRMADYWVSESDNGQVDASQGFWRRSSSDWVGWQNSDGHLLSFGVVAHCKATDAIGVPH